MSFVLVLERVFVPSFSITDRSFPGIAFKDVKADSKLFPSIGLKKIGEHVRVNFGQVPFTFDIDGVMKVGTPLLFPCFLLSILLVFARVF